MTLSQAARFTPPAELGWVPAAPGFEVSLPKGMRLAGPVTATTKVDPQPSTTKRLVFLTRPAGSDRWEGLPVTLKGDQASVTMEHFSTGWFGWVDDASQEFKKGINAYLKLRFDPPECEGKPLTIGDTTYTSSITGNGLYVCIEEVDGKPALTTYSNSPFVWRVAAPKGRVTPAMPLAPVETAGVVTAAAHRSLHSARLDRETVVVPGGRGTLALNDTSTLHVQAETDAGLGLIAVLLAGVDTYLGVSGQSLKSLDKAKIGECAVGALEAGGKTDPGKVTRAVIDCLVSVSEGALSVPLGIVSSLSGLLVTQILGIIGEIDKTNQLTITVQTKNSAVSAAEPGADPSTATSAASHGSTQARQWGIRIKYDPVNYGLYDIEASGEMTFSFEKFEDGFRVIGPPELTMIFHNENNRSALRYRGFRLFAAYPSNSLVCNLTSVRGLTYERLGNACFVQAMNLEIQQPGFKWIPGNSSLTYIRNDWIYPLGSITWSKIGQDKLDALRAELGKPAAIVAEIHMVGTESILSPACRDGRTAYFVSDVSACKTLGLEVATG